MEDVKIRETTCAGEIYPADKDQLKKMVDDALKSFAENKVDYPFALITPYGSYKYALQAYGASYSQIINERYDTIVILSPVHKIAFPGIALSDKDYFANPLGDVEIDKEANNLLIKYNNEFIFHNNKYHDLEYSIEAQLPFINSIFNKKIKILPVIIGETNTKFTMILSGALKNLIEETKKKYLFVAVTNLSSNIKYEEAVKMDNDFVNTLLCFNPDHLAEQLAMKQIMAFGGGGVITILRLAKLLNIKNIRILRLVNSGDITGEKLKVEGYLSSVLWK